MSDWYMLDENKTVVPAPMDDAKGLPTIEFFQWFNAPENKIVRQETVNKCWISTVFLGLDHRFGSSGPPVVFETMIFPRREDEKLIESDSWRYCTYAEALEGHKAAVRVAQQYGSGLEPEELKKAARIISDLADYNE